MGKKKEVKEMEKKMASMQNCFNCRNFEPAKTVTDKCVGYCGGEQELPKKALTPSGYCQGWWWNENTSVYKGWLEQSQKSVGVAIESHKRKRDQIKEELATL